MSINADKMDEFLEYLKANINKYNHYFKNERYLLILVKQYSGLIRNVKAIDALIEINDAEDAFTIFRKYLETYLIMMSVLNNKNLVDLYVEHDKYIGKKACKIELNEVKAFCKNKPDGYLEYGYLESVVDTSDSDFKYTMKTVAKAAGLYNLYTKGYRISNNFVHNNLTSVNIDVEDLKNKLVKLCSKSIEDMIFKYKEII